MSKLFEDVQKAKILSERDREEAAKAGISRYSFVPKKGKDLVHPMLVHELLGGGYSIVDGPTTSSISVDQSNKSNRFFDEYNVRKSGDHSRIEWNNPDDAREFFTYAHVGTSPSGVEILRCSYCSGGSGIFCDVGLFRWEFSSPDKQTLDLKLIETIPLGDRYEGEVVYENQKLLIHPDRSRWGNGPDSPIERRID